MSSPSDFVDIGALIKEAGETGQNLFELLKLRIWRTMVPEVSVAFSEQLLLIESLVILNLGVSLVVLPLRATGAVRLFDLRHSRHGTFYVPSVMSWLLAYALFLACLLASAVLTRRVYHDGDVKCLAVQAFLSETCWMMLWATAWLLAWSTMVDSIEPVTNHSISVCRRRSPAALLNAFALGAPLAYAASTLPFIVRAHIHLGRGNRVLTRMFGIIDEAKTLADLLPVSAISQKLIDELALYIKHLTTGETIWLAWTALLALVRVFDLSSLTLQFILASLALRIQRSTADMRRLGELDPYSTLVDGSIAATANKTAIPADVSVRHLRRSLWLDILQLTAMLLSTCCYTGLLAWKIGHETVAATDPIAVQVSRLLLCWIYAIPGLFCAAASFYQSLPTKHSQGKTSAPTSQPRPQSSLTESRIRVGIDMEALARHGGTKERIGF